MTEAAPPQFECARVESPEDWAQYHKIREEELFLGRTGRVYDPHYPDERLPNNIPFLLKRDGVGIATTRLDVRPHEHAAVIRLVATTKSEQGKGYGRKMQEYIEAFAQENGITKLLLNAAPEAEGFYIKLGFTYDPWDPSELTGISANSIQMSKSL